MHWNALDHLGIQLKLGLLIALLVPMSIGTGYAMFYYSRHLENQALANLETTLKLAIYLHEGSLHEINNQAQSYARQRGLALLLGLDVNEKLARELGRIAEQDRLGAVHVLDRRLRVVARAHNPPSFGDLSPSHPAYEKALEGVAASYLEYWPAEALKSENLSAPFGTVALSWTGVAPIYDREGLAVLGVMVVRRWLDKTFPMSIQHELDLETAVFIPRNFFVSSLNSSTLKAQPNFFEIPLALEKTLLSEGLTGSQVSMKPGGALSRYAPLLDYHSRPLAILMVSSPSEPYLQLQATALKRLVGIALLGVLLALGLVTLIQRRISLRIDKMIRNTGLIASGQYQHRLAIPARDKLGQLAESFNQMTEKLQQSYESLLKSNAELQRLKEGLQEVVERRTQDLLNVVETLQERDQLIQDELSVAADIQRGLLPANPWKRGPLQGLGSYLPMNQVGGDFYDILSMPGGRTGILMADAMGHGIPAALMTIMAKIAFEEAVQAETSPVAILRVVNQTLRQILHIESYLTAFLVVIEPSGAVCYSNAAHCRALVLRANSGQCEDWDTEGAMLGFFPDEDIGGTYQEKTSFLEAGDRLFLYTDGLIDARNAHNKSFGSARLRQFLMNTLSEPLEQVQASLLQVWNPFSQHPHIRDDMAFVLAEFLP